MPRTPILARRGFFDYVNRNLAQTRPLEWNAVDTELGLMVEPRNVAGIVDGRIVQQDLKDMAFDSETYLDRGTFYQQYNTDGQQLMVDFNY